MAFPYFKEEKSARVLLAVVICFTLANSGVSVGSPHLPPTQATFMHTLRGCACAYSRTLW